MNKKINLIDAYEHGISLSKLYILTNNAIPNTYTRNFEEVLVDMENIDVDGLRKHFSNAQFKFDIVDSDLCTSSEEKIVKLTIDASYVPENSSITILDGSVFYLICADSIEILYQSEDPKQLLKEIMEFIPVLEEEPEEAEIKLVSFNGSSYYTITSKIKETKIDLSENYNDDFLNVHKDIVNFLNERNSGLIILRGDKGLGKTYYIRHLINSIPKNYILITNAMAAHLAAPEFISFMLDHKDSVFILEDCEQILMKRNEFVINSAISNILNMSDGIMSDIFNIKFICTFNADIDRIDDALLRKGRCYANYEFKKLSKEKTKNLLNKNGITLDSYTAMSLADIYHFGDTSYNESVKKIGF